MKKHNYLWVSVILLSALTISGCQGIGYGNKFGFGEHQPSVVGWTGNSKVASMTSTNYHQTKKASLIIENDNEPNVLFRPELKDTVPYQSSLGEVNFDVTSNSSYTSPNFAPMKKPHIETMVGRKIKEMYKELLDLQTAINKHETGMRRMQVVTDEIASKYYSAIATINSHLQSGTTPGNPELIDMWTGASKQLEKLSKNSDELTRLSNNISDTASKVAFLLDATQATFGISGAVEEDHENLIALEDDINQTVIKLNRMLNNVNDEINRRNSYLRSERLNLQVLSLAIANGELYGKSMTSRLFTRVADAEAGFSASGGYTKPPATSSNRPLVVIKFDRPNIQYQQPLYVALSETLEKYPAAEFDIVAISPVSNNPAEMALAVTDARRNSEDVLRSMTQMGVPTDRIKMGAAQIPNILSSEVHLYVR